jgi:phenylacetate-coenzyme A ligase PaaK-like adenylate-forming protein
MHSRTPLEAWVAAKAGLGAFTRDALERYQLTKLRDTVRWARLYSRVYAQRLGAAAENELNSLADLRRLPFTTASDLREDAGGFLCVSQGEVSRVVTLKTSGTSGEPKRVYFTAEDQESAVDFFHRGISTLAGPDDRVLIALPYERAGGVGDLLTSAVRRLGATPVPFGPVLDPSRAFEAILRKRVTCAVGVPTELLAVARCESGFGPLLRSVALCGDHVPGSLVQALREAWGCDVFEHYGSTEMGLGGGVDCKAHSGYHLREADLYFEIVDPATGTPVAFGEYGEVVFTTLTRRAMPLIRYRTGDISRLIAGPCACGSLLQRLERVRQRTNAAVPLGAFGELSMTVLDEALFAVPGLRQFTADLDSSGIAALTVTACGPGRHETTFRSDVVRALRAVPVLERAREAAALRLIVRVSDAPAEPLEGKRRIHQCRA